MGILDKFPTKYLKCIDFDNGDIVTIKRVVMEIVGQDGTEKPVIYFKEQGKGAVLNVTNARSLAGVFGDDESIWAGKKVTLSSIKVRKPGGDVTDSICMTPAPSAPKRVAAEINDEIPDFA